MLMAGAPIRVEKHPPGLYVLFFTEMWERFGFYTMVAMFTLYLRNPTQGFGWTAAEATGLYANYLMFVYASPLIGGFIADRGLGYRNSVLIGGLVFMVGYALFTIRELWAVYLALTCLVVGNGFFKPNVSAMVGHLYPEGSTLKDRAYNIFYMGINIGAFFAPLVAEFVQSQFGFGPAFAVASGGMVISVSILWAFKHHVEGAQHRTPVTLPTEPEARQPDEAHVYDPARKERLLAGIPPEGVAESPTADLPPPHVPAPRKNPMDTVPDWQRVGALIVIFLIVIVFWMVFHQNGSTLTYWADDNTAWKVSGIIANAINPFWVVTLTFPLVWVWKWLDQRGLEPSTPMKMAMGMFLSAVSFAILYFAARTGEAIQPGPDQYATADFRLTEWSLAQIRAAGVPEDVIEKLEARDREGKYLVRDRKFATTDQASGEQKLSDALRMVLGSEETAKYQPIILQYAYIYKVSPLWLIIAYAVMTLGELLLSPMGLSLVSKVAPVHLRGLMMGGWFVATAVGNKLTMIGVFWDRWLHSEFFAMLGMMALVTAIVLLVLLYPLKKAMPGA
jgi:POT family proton-dependent oligopeptide transporter